MSEAERLSEALTGVSGILVTPWARMVTSHRLFKNRLLIVRLVKASIF